MLYHVILYQQLFFKTYHTENKLYLICFDKYLKSPPKSSLNSFISSLFLVNGPEALSVNLDYFKCISGINLSTDNKDLFTIAFILHF